MWPFPLKSEFPVSTNNTEKGIFINLQNFSSFLGREAVLNNQDSPVVLKFVQMEEHTCSSVMM